MSCRGLSRGGDSTSTTGTRNVERNLRHRQWQEYVGRSNRSISKPKSYDDFTSSRKFQKTLPDAQTLSRSASWHKLTSPVRNPRTIRRNNSQTMTSPPMSHTRLGRRQYTSSAGMSRDNFRTKTMASPLRRKLHIPYAWP